MQEQKQQDANAELKEKSYEFEKAQKLKLEAENLDDSDSRKKNFLARALEKFTEIKKSLFEAQQSANEAKKQLDATIKAQAKKESETN